MEDFSDFTSQWMDTGPGLTADLDFDEDVEVNDHLEKGQYFFADIKNEGVLLYDSGQYQLAQEKPHSTALNRSMFVSH